MHMDEHHFTHRHDHEAEVYDARAEELLATRTDEHFRVGSDLPPYPNREHVEFLDFALEQIQPVAGKRILEVGSGPGELATWLALQGAEVLAIDVSRGNVDLGRRRARVNGVDDRAVFRHVPVETLDEPDGSFDVVIGNQVLHHVELTEAMPNIHRMLAPGGQAVFCEPVLFLPEGARRLRNHEWVTAIFPSRADTPDERSVSLSDLDVILASFDRGTWRPFQLTCRLQNFVHLSDSWFSRLSDLDRMLLRNVRPARRLARYVVTVLERTPAMTAA